MFHELRIYHCCPGRLPALIERFKKSTLGFFDRHGIHYEGFWVTAIGQSNSTLTYLLRWHSLAERDLKWRAFQEDEDWRAIRTESEKSGPIVDRIENQILSPVIMENPL